MTMNNDVGVEKTALDQYKIAEYKFDNTIYDLFPEFNDGFTYTHEDIVEGNVTTRTIYTLKDKIINIENDSSYPAPGIIDDILQYSCSEWEVATIDLSEYAGKNVDISFTITAKTETWCEFGITKEDSSETICAIWEPDSAIKIFDYNTTIENIPNDFKLILEGMNGIVSNINIIVEGENLFPSKLITEHYLYENMNCYSTTPTLHDDNTLEFTTHWRHLYVNIQDYKNKNLHVSFDIKGIPNDIGWSEFEYAFVNSNEQNYDMIEDHIFYTTLTEEMNYHVEFDAMVTENTHFYLGGMGGHIENLQILVDNELPTLIRFGAETTSNRTLSLLEVDYLDTSNVTTMKGMFRACTNLVTLNLSSFNTSNVTDMGYMFQNCTSLTSLDLNSFNTIKVTDMRNMFQNCESLTSLDISNFDISIANTSNILNSCNSLTYINMDNSNVSSINIIISYLPTKTPDNPGTLKTGTSQASSCDKIIADIMYWNVTDKFLIARYTTNASGIVPTFNEGYQYTVNETENNGIYTVELNSNTDFSYCSFSESSNLLTVEYLKVTNNVTDIKRMFYYCNNLTSVDANNFDISNVTDMSYMFYRCGKLTLIEGISNWNTEKLTTLYCTFTYCHSLTELNIGDWCTNNLNSLYCTFYECKNLEYLNVSNWNTSNVTALDNLFWYCEKLTSIDVSNWNLENANSIQGIFSYCHSLKDLDVSNWYMPKATDIRYVFVDCWLLEYLDLSNWGINGANMYGMFHSCFALKELNMDHWNVQGTGNMKYLIWGCESLNTLSINGWKLNNGVSLDESIVNCNLLNTVYMNNSDYNSVNKIINRLPTRTTDSMGVLYIVGVDDINQVNTTTAESKCWNIIDKYKIAEYKFTNSTDLVPVFNEGFVYTYEDIENGTTTIRTIYSTELPTTINFTNQTRLMEVYYLNTSNLTSTYDLFYGCTNLTYVDFRNSNFSKVETIERMFAFCENLIKIDGLNDIDVSNVNNMGGLFTDCPKIPELDVKDWDVSKVTNFGAVFRRCTALSKIDVSKWNTSSGVIMSGIFTNCSNLTEIDIYNWDTTNANSVSQMFYGCSKLKLIKSFNHIGPNTVTTYLFGKCTSLQHVQLPDSDVYTINKVIEELPTRNATDPGILDILGADIIDQVNKASAKNKYWNIIAIHNAIKKVHIGNRPISTLSQQNKKIKNIYFGDNKLY